MEKISSNDHYFIPIIRISVRLAGLVFVLLMLFTVLLIFGPTTFEQSSNSNSQAPDAWEAPRMSTIPTDETGNLIRYGRELIINTSHYLGPRGTVMKISNGMNCQNCHLEAGTKQFGNNFSAVTSTYPKYRPRYGSIESIEKRINDCLERSLNGSTLDSTSHEMRAMVAYIGWIGKDVKKGDSPVGSGSVPL